MEELNSKISDMEVHKKTYKKIKIKKMNKTDKICQNCNKSITKKICFCDNLPFYKENIKSIIKIQKLWRKKQLLKCFLYKKLTKKQKLVNEIFKPDKNGISGWITRNYLSNTNLKLSRNGNCRHGKFFNDSRFIWEKKIEKNMVVSLRTVGFDLYNNDNINNRAIRKDIKEYHYKIGCVCCGSKSDLVIDHKNDLYNDPSVLNINTQTLGDFQCLCNHCNLQKRQVCIYTKQYKKRYGATNIPQLKIFDIDFTVGDDTLNINDVNALKGTYWYDPIAFMEYIKNSMIYK
jgi:hypothetical protein